MTISGEIVFVFNDQNHIHYLEEGHTSLDTIGIKLLDWLVNNDPFKIQNIKQDLVLMTIDNFDERINQSYSDFEHMVCFHSDISYVINLEKNMFYVSGLDKPENIEYIYDDEGLCFFECSLDDIQKIRKFLNGQR